jgi:hypothetical protein
MAWMEWVGYAASVLIAVSMTMNNLWRLRWICTAGAAAFAVYGFAVKAYPVFALNAFIVATNLYYLLQMSTRRDYFSLLPVGEQSVFRDRFLEFYRDDIARHFPGFAAATLAGTESVFVLRNLMPVGLFVYERRPGGVVAINLDYVVPSYRDLKNAVFLFAGKWDELRAQGFHTFVAKSTVPSHQRYLRRAGFLQDAQSPDVFRKPINR